MAVNRIVIFGSAYYRPGGLVFIHVEQELFCLIIPMLLENATKRFGLHESNVLSVVFLSTVVFGMSGRRALCAPDILIFEV